jgi:hypothetical protein
LHIEKNVLVHNSGGYGDHSLLGRGAVFSFVLYCFFDGAGNVLDYIASNGSTLLIIGKLERIWKEAAQPYHRILFPEFAGMY